MTARRLKRGLLVTTLAGSLLAMLAWTQPWATLAIRTPDLDQDFVSTGGDAATAVMAFALATLAAVGALAIAGRVFRYVIGALTALLGVGTTIASGVAMTDPVSGFVPVVREFTAVTDEVSIRETVAEGTIQTTAWPLAGLAAGVIIAVGAILVVLTAHRWPETGRKYSQTRFAGASGESHEAQRDRVSQWDALSAGDDPTESGDESENPR